MSVGGGVALGVGVTGAVVSGTDEAKSEGAGLNSEAIGLGLGLSSTNSFAGMRANDDPETAMGTCMAMRKRAATSAVIDVEGERINGS